MLILICEGEVFMAKKRSNLTIIVGCGQLGSRIANEIYHGDANVIVIDRHPDAFSLLDSSFGGLTIVGDACDFEILKKADIEQASCVIAVTDFENNNIFIGQAARKLFYVEKVIIRVLNDDLRPIYESMGISTVCPAQLTAEAVMDFYNAGGSENE